MAEIFWHYVATLGADQEDPENPTHDDILEELRIELIHDLRRRGLWCAPPRFLGLVDSSWTGGALDDLVNGVYIFIFHDRLEALFNRLPLVDNLRPMVILNIRHFLTDLQKTTDPLGYKVFLRLRGAVTVQIDAGRLFALGAGPGIKNIGNCAVLGFQPGPVPASLTDRRDLVEIVRLWNDDLLPRLVTARSRTVPKVEEELAQKIVSLRDCGITAFRFGDLIHELKADARARWESNWRQSLGKMGTRMVETHGAPEPVPVARPEDDLDWPRVFLQVRDCVTAKIAQQAPAWRRDLSALWDLVLSLDEPPKKPSFQVLAQQLDLDRGRVAKLWRCLQELALSCLDSTAPPVPTTC